MREATRAQGKTPRPGANPTRAPGQRSRLRSPLKHLEELFGGVSCGRIEGIELDRALSVHDELTPDVIVVA